MVTSDLEEPAVSILCSEGGGRTFVLQKIVVLYCIVMEICKPRTWNMLNWVHKNATYWALQQNTSVISCFHMISFINSYNYLDVMFF